MRRLTSVSRDDASVSGASIEVGSTVAVPPNRCDRFGPALLQIGEHFGGFVEAPLLRLGYAEIQNSQHPARDIFAREVQALHRLAQRLLDDRMAPGAAPPQGAIQQCQDLIAPAEPPVQLRGILLIRLAHFVSGPVLSGPSGFKPCARRFSSWILS